ncbi:response regulator [Methylocapsa polymorpha]|uniref:Response regulator n=1 Tax=Methylocapsa polymorpha TaxID=3080828 RepID=A0ABZ0HR26_9HYPH|nr:response regulator [Methylocapsa sp. RX1]
MISVIDDDEHMCSATKNLVQSLGYSVYAFSSAEEFLRSPRSSDTSCLITDIQMPGMSGIELQAHLIDQGRLASIIFITAYPDEGLRARALEAGAICFLNKPFHRQALIECLDEAVRRHSVRGDED